MKNIFLIFVFWLVFGDLTGQNSKFFDPDYRDCVQFGAQYYTYNPALGYGDFVFTLHYSHDFLQKNYLFLRSRTGIDCFVDWGFHLQTGLMAGGRVRFLEYSIGPVLHSGSFFWEHNNSGFLGVRNNHYFKLGLNIGGSATIAKILVLGYEWQGFKTKAVNFSSNGIPIGTDQLWAISHALKLGFWF